MTQEGAPNNEGQSWSREDREHLDYIDEILSDVDGISPEGRAKIAEEVDRFESLKLSEGALRYLDVLLKMTESGNTPKRVMIERAAKAVKDMREKGDTTSDNYKAFEAYLIITTGENE